MFLKTQKNKSFSSPASILNKFIDEQPGNQNFIGLNS
jgi:hypothetical protein